MKKTIYFITDTKGDIISSASVTVYLTGTTTKATIYSDEGSTPKANPLTSDSKGEVWFYVADGDYDIKVEKTGIVTFTLSDITIVDAKTAADEAHDGTIQIPKTQNTITKEPTGFTNSSAVTVTYNSTTRKITIAGTFVAYYQGEIVSALVDGWESAAHTATTGVWYLYHDGTDFVWSQTIWTFDVLQIAFVHYGTSDKFALRECHGLMPHEAHLTCHDTIGTYRDSGGVLSNYTLTSTTAANRRLDVSETAIYDEDLKSTLATLTSSVYMQAYLAGAGSENSFNVDAADIVPLSTNRPYWNEYTGGAWQQTLMSNNTYMCIWLITIPSSADATSQKYRYVCMQGQSNGSLADEQVLIPANLQLSALTVLTPEFVFISKIIIKYTGGNWILQSVEDLTGSRYIQTASPTANLSGYVIGPTSAVNNNFPAFDGTTGVLIKDSGEPVLKSKRDATQAPTVNNDTTEGYSVGSEWDDVTNDEAYVCLDATEGAAVWTEITGGGAGNPKEISFFLPGDAYVGTGLGYVLVGTNLAKETISKVKIKVLTAPVGSVLTVDCTLNGTTIFTDQGKRPEIADGATADDSDTPDVTAMSEGDYLSWDIDAVGSGTAGANVMVTFVFA